MTMPQTSILVRPVLLALCLFLHSFMQAQWESIGPTGNGWTDTFGSVIGRVRSIHIQQVAADYDIYAGASSGGVWRARGSSGPDWTDLQCPGLAVGAVAVDPTNSLHIVVGNGDPARYDGTGEVYYSLNGGLSWTRQTIPATATAVYRIAFLPTDGNTILMATNAGLLRCTGGIGSPFAVVLPALVTDFQFSPQNSTTVFACRYLGGVVKSTDGGATWGTTPITPDTLAARFQNARLAICRDAPGVMAFVYSFNNAIGGIGRSTDGGNVWTFPAFPVAGSGEASHALAITFKPDNPNILFYGSAELYRTDGFLGAASWTNLRDIEHHQDQTQLYFSPVTGDNILWICNDGGIYRHDLATAFSVSWNGNQTTGLRISQVCNMDVRRGLVVVGLQDDGSMATTNGGLTWVGNQYADVYELAITDPFNNVYWGKVHPNSPERVGVSPRSVQSIGDASITIRDLVYDRWSGLVYSNTGTTIRSRNANATTPAPWTLEITLPSATGRIILSPVDGNTMYGYSSDTLVVLQRGSSWSVLRTVVLNGTIRDVIASRDWPGESWVLLVSPGGATIAHSTDLWATFSSRPLPVKRPWGLAVVPLRQQQMYLASDSSIFVSSDGGGSWAPFGANLPLLQQRKVLYVPDAAHSGIDKLYAGTLGRGVYRRSIPAAPLVYVNPALPPGGDGTLDFPYATFNEGYGTAPSGSILVLAGGTYAVPMVLDQPVSISAYQSSPVTLVRQ